MAPARTKPVPPIPEPFCVTYAPTGRAACKSCSGLIAQQVIRFGRKVRSPWHDGFEIQWNHLKCGFEYADDLDDVKGWQALKWKDVKRCAKLFGVQIDENDENVKNHRKLNEMLWSVKDYFSECSLKVLKLLLDENNIFYTHKLTAQEAVHIIADALVFGRLPTCPICDQNALLQQGPLLTCTSYVEGAAKCEFKFNFFDLLHPSVVPDNTRTGVTSEDLIRIGLLKIPPQLASSPIFKSLKLPEGSPSLQFASTTKCSLKKREKLDSDDESLEDVPKLSELMGISFASLGVKSKTDVESLIIKHGGTYHDDVQFDTTYLLVSDEATTKALKGKKRFDQALAFGVPVMRESLIDAAILRDVRKPPIGKKSRTACKDESSSVILPTGIILRQRKFAKWYKLCGGVGKKILTVKECTEKRKADQSAKKLENENRKESRKRLPIAIGSTLLKIDSQYPKNKKSNRMSYSIYVDELNNAYNCTTNLSDISTGVNKFYSLQLIKISKDANSTSASSALSDSSLNSSGDAFEDLSVTLMNSAPLTKRRKVTKRIERKSKPKYTLFKKWGRIGDGSSLKNDCMTAPFSTDLAGALDEFQKKFTQLTGKDWDDRFDSKIKPGRYRVMEIEGHMTPDYIEAHQPKNNKSPKDSKTTSSLIARSTPPQIAECTLLPEVLTLMKLLFDKSLMEEDSKRQNLDLKKMPLGCITRRQMVEGYDVLQQLQGLLVESVDQKKTLKWASRVTAATNRFYSCIPHQFSLVQTPPLIDTLARLRAKVDMMEQLLDIKIANTIIDEAMRTAEAKHPHDSMYEQLKCLILPVNKGSAEFLKLQSSMRNTHAKTHNSFRLDLQEVYRCKRQAEDEHDLDCASHGNRKLLWHGSRLSNWASILSNGLHIAPKEAPSTGFMFGKGIYFADIASKSAQYCNATSSEPWGVLVVAEVCLGEAHVCLEADTAAAKHVLEKGCGHTWGVGQMHPNPNCDELIKSTADGSLLTLKCGVPVPNSTNISMAIEKFGCTSNLAGGSSLMYNEYVVYKESQVTLEYLLLVKFAYTSLLDDDDESNSSDAESSDDDHKN